MAHWEFPPDNALGYEEISLNTGATAVPKGLNPPTNPDSGAPAGNAFVQCQRGTARVRLDGGNPTGASGFMLNAGDGMILTGPRVLQTKFVSDTQTASLLSIHYFV